MNADEFAKIIAWLEYRLRAITPVQAEAMFRVIENNILYRTKDTQ